MKKRDYKNIERLQLELLKKVNTDFLESMDNQTQAIDNSVMVENENNNNTKIIAKATTHKVESSKTIGARLLATDIYKGLKKDKQNNPSAIASFKLDGFYCIDGEDFIIRL